MTRMISASCDDGKVTADGVEVPGAIILSGGQGSSTGILLIDGLMAIYVASNAGDLSTTLEKLSTALETIGDTLTKISTMFTSIGASMTGPTTAPPPTLAIDVAEIVSSVAEITAIKQELDELRGDLQ